MSRPEAFQLFLFLAIGVGTLAPRRFQWLAGAALCWGIVLLATPPHLLGRSLLIWLENRYSTAQVQQVSAPDGIIIAGGGLASYVVDALRGMPVDEAGRGGRIAGAVNLARRFPRAKIVYTGREELSARDVLTSLGIASDRIVVEDRSTSTYENAVNAAQLLNPKRGQQWILVTSAVHLPRAAATFRSAGFSVVGYPVDSLAERSGENPGGDAEFDRSIAVAVREIAAILGYCLTGRIHPLSLLP